MTSVQLDGGTTNKGWFCLVVLFLIVELGRPQATLPIGFLRPGLIITWLLCFNLFTGLAPERLKNKQVILVGSFVVLLATYIPFVVNTFMAYHAFRTLLLLMPFFLSAIITINSRSRLVVFILSLIYIMGYDSLYAIIHGGVGPGGDIEDENDLTLFIVIMLPFCFFILSQVKRKITRRLVWVVIVLALLAVIKAFSRGGFIGLVAMGFVYWWYSPRKLLTMVLVMFMAGAMALIGGDRYVNEMSTVTDTKENTAQSRLLSWEAGWDMFLDNPLGVGGYNFPIRFPEYQPPELHRNMWGRAAHSLWFTLFPEVGLIGTFIYFRLIYVNIRDVFAFRKSFIEDIVYSPNFFQSLSIAILASFAGFFAAGSFISVLYYSHFWYLTVIVVTAKQLSDQCSNQ